MSQITARRHGTYSGYTGGCRCADCREASREYRREYRAANASTRRYDRNQTRDHRRAMAILRERHRDEFDEIYYELRGLR